MHYYSSQLNYFGYWTLNKYYYYYYYSKIRRKNMMLLFCCLNIFGMYLSLSNLAYIFMGSQ